jgi:hypothetical protein
MNRYFSEFKTSRSNSDRLLMIGTNGVDPFDASVNPNVVELTLSADPISISSSDNTSIFAPVKSSGCTVSIVSDKYHFDLYSSRYNDVIGYILDENDNILFYGFNTPNIYQQDWLSLDTIELEFISALSATEYCDYRNINPNGTHIHSMWSIIKFILEEVGYDDKFKIKLYADTNVDLQNGLNILRYYLNEENFFDDSEDRKPWKMKEVLEEIMRFMGYTLFVHHNTIYIVDYQSITSSNTYWQYENGNFVKVENDIIPWKIDETYYAGAGATVSLDMTYNKVTCTANTYPIDNLLDDIFNEDVIVLSNTRQVNITSTDPSGNVFPPIFVSDITSPFLHVYSYDTVEYANTITNNGKEGWHYEINGGPINSNMFRQGTQPFDSIDPGDFDTTDILCVNTGMPSCEYGFPSEARDPNELAKLQHQGLVNLYYDQFNYFVDNIKLKPMFTVYGKEYVYSTDTDRYIIFTGDVMLSNQFNASDNAYALDGKTKDTIVEYAFDEDDPYAIMAIGENWDDDIRNGIHLIPVRISIGDKYYVHYNKPESEGVYEVITGWFTKEQIQQNNYYDYTYINVGGQLTGEGNDVKVSLNTNEWKTISTNFRPNFTTDDVRPDADGGWAIKIPKNTNLVGTLKIEVLNWTYDFYDYDFKDKYRHTPSIRHNWVFYMLGPFQGVVGIVPPNQDVYSGNAVNVLLGNYLWEKPSSSIKAYNILVTRLPTCMLFKSFKATLVGEINVYDEMNNKQDDDTEYTNVINESFVEEFDDLEVNINTQHKKKKPSYSSVYVNNNGILRELQKVNYNGKSLLQEEHLVEKYVNHYSTPKRIVEMTTKYKENDANESFPSPENVVNYELFAGDTKFIVSGIEEDIKNETCGITLIEV